MSTPINASESEADSDGTTSLDIATPSGTASGDLLVVLVTVDDAIVTTSMTGFTELYQEVSETFVVGSAYYRVSDGTEGANLTITLSSSEQVCARAVRITDFSGTPFFEVSSIGNSTTQTPPPITPSGGSSDYLYLVHDHIDTNNATISSFPSGYTNTGDVISTRTRLAWGEKSTLATTSETPGDFTISATRRAVVSTIAIASVAAGGSVTVTGTTPNYSYIGISGAVDLTGAVVVTGQTPSYAYSSISGAIDLTGSIDVLGQTANYSYSSTSGAIDLTGAISIVGVTASYSYQSISGSIDLTGEISVLGATPNYAYNSISGLIELGALISVIGQTPNYNYAGVNGVIELVGEINVNGSTPSYSYSAISGFVVIGGGQKIGTVTAGFAPDLYSADFKPSVITVKFKS